MDTHRFTLYVVAGARASRAASENLRRILHEADLEDFELEIIDVSVNAEAAEVAGILATPTLIRHRPLPQRRIVGDLSDAATVRAALGLPVAYRVAMGASD